MLGSRYVDVEARQLPLSGRAVLPDVRSTWDLLRRDDLGIVRIPWFSPRGQGTEDVAVRDWLDKHLPGVEFDRPSSSHVSESS